MRPDCAGQSELARMSLVYIPEAGVFLLVVHPAVKTTWFVVNAAGMV